MPSNAQSRVLFVDDDQDACEMLDLLLRPHEIRLTCANSAEEGWPKIKAEKFDLYLLDGWLPKTDGFELCRQIREFDPQTPILFYSGAAYEADKKKAREAGATAYVTKPDIYDLIQTMLALVAKAPEVDVSARWAASEQRPRAISLSTPFLLFNTASR